MLWYIKRHYQNLQSPVKASMWFLICGFGQKGVSLLTTPVFTRIMTNAEYGRYSVYSSWLSIVEIIVSLNLAAGVYTRGLIKNEDDQDRFSSSLLGLSTTCVLIWSVIYIIFQRIINDLLGITTFLAAAMLLETWAHSAYQFWSNKERVNFRYKKLVVLTLLYVILRPVLGIIFVLLADQKHQAEARVCAITLVNVCLFSMLYIAIVKNGKQYYNKKYWLYALKFNLPLLPHYLSQTVLSQSDRIMISHIQGSTEAAYYSVAYTLAMVLQILNTSISATMNPWIYKAIKNREYKKIGEVSYSVLVIVALANLAIVVIAPELMGILAPSDYKKALWVVPPVTASVYFMFLYNLFATFEYYFEKTYYVTVATVIGAGLNIVLNSIFIPRFGFVAAGYTTLVCYILYAFAHYRFMRRVNRIYMDNCVVYDDKVIILLGGVLLAACFFVIHVYKRPELRYIIFALLMLIMIVNRGRVFDLINKIKRKNGF